MMMILVHSAWLFDDIHPLIARVSRRAEGLANLTVESAEDLQVSINNCSSVVVIIWISSITVNKATENKAMSSFHFYSSNQSKVFPLGCTLRTGNVSTQIFGSVRCPILRIKTHSTPQCWCCLVADIWKKADWIGNWKYVMRQIALTSLSRRHVTLGIVECRK